MVELKSMRGVGKAVAVLAVLAAGIAVISRPADPLPGLPRIFIWAWERPEDLSALDPRSAGVAFLARTVFFHHAAVSVRPRQQPLRFAPGAVLMAVVRVESAGAPLPSPAAAAEAIVPAARIAAVRALQIDFDAVASERPFYRELLTEVRRRMPASMPLSITALASWCDGDRWLHQAPVAEAVPMLFRAQVRVDPVRMQDPLCRSSAGVSTDEPLPRPPRGRRVYVFSPRAWSPQDLRAAIHEVARWQ